MRPSGKPPKGGPGVPAGSTVNRNLPSIIRDNAGCAALPSDASCAGDGPGDQFAIALQSGLNPPARR